VAVPRELLQQMGKIGLVARRVNNKIPDFEGTVPAALDREAVPLTTRA
jgi:hypothetical protein